MVIQETAVKKWLMHGIMSFMQSRLKVDRWKEYQITSQNVPLEDYMMQWTRRYDEYKYVYARNINSMNKSNGSIVAGLPRSLPTQTAFNDTSSVHQSGYYGLAEVLFCSAIPVGLDRLEHVMHP